MKIGFSFGRCVASIVRGDVDINDVMCIIARTLMPKAEDVEWVIAQYLDTPGYLMGLDPDKCREVGLELWMSGRVIEPRSNGVYAARVPKEYVWMDLYPTEADVRSDGVKEAWNTYRMMLTLTEQIPEPNAQAVQHGERLVEQKPIDPNLINAMIM